MRRLTVLYDADCDLCRGARSWLERQRQLVPLDFVPAGSTVASRRFPSLDVAAVLRELHVIDDQGQVWRGHKAWLICLWSLETYRSWAVRLAARGLEPHARRFVAWVSRNRRRVRLPAGSMGAAS